MTKSVSLNRNVWKFNKIYKKYTKFGFCELYKLSDLLRILCKYFKSRNRDKLKLMAHICYWNVEAASHNVMDNWTKQDQCNVKL